MLFNASGLGAKSEPVANSMVGRVSLCAQACLALRLPTACALGGWHKARYLELFFVTGHGEDMDLHHEDMDSSGLQRAPGGERVPHLCWVVFAT